MWVRRAPPRAPQLSPHWALVPGGRGPLRLPHCWSRPGSPPEGGVSVAAAPGHGGGDCASPALGLPRRHTSPRNVLGTAPARPSPADTAAWRGPIHRRERRRDPSPAEASRCPGPDWRTPKGARGGGVHVGSCAAAWHSLPLTFRRHRQEVPRPGCPRAQHPALLRQSEHLGAGAGRPQAQAPPPSATASSAGAAGRRLGPGRPSWPP